VAERVVLEHQVAALEQQVEALQGEVRHTEDPASLSDNLLTSQGSEIFQAEILETSAAFRMPMQVPACRSLYGASNATSASAAAAADQCSCRGVQHHAAHDC